MTPVFGRYVLLDSDGDYNCEICSRWFYSEQAILAHCRNTNHHEWCDRCQRVFKTEHAKQEHLRLSSSHNICSLCIARPDFAYFQDLKDHYEEFHFPCRSCSLVYPTPDTLYQHIDSASFGCDICFRHFNSENDFRQHMKVHEEKNLECPVCDRTFSRLSYVLLHLERSRCSSISKVNDLAEVFDYDYDCSSFSCDYCERIFDNLSGLFQHVEDTPDCSHLLEGYGSTLRSLAEYIFDHVY